MREYNGHPSYEHWNAALWFLNDVSLYNLALQAENAEDLEHMLDMMCTKMTPDGVELTSELITYAFNCVHE